MATIYTMMEPAKLPGARTVVTWSPASMSKRLREMVTARFTQPLKNRGLGYSSASEDVVRVVSKHFKVPYLLCHDDHHFTIMRNGTPPKPEVTALLEQSSQAVKAAARLAGENINIWPFSYGEGSILVYLTRGHGYFYFRELTGPTYERLLELYAPEREAALPRILEFLNSDEVVQLGDFTRTPRINRPEKAK